MTEVCQVIRCDEFAVLPVNRPRLARYLGLPSVSKIDPITDAEIRKLDSLRSELFTPWHIAIAIPIDRIEGRSIELKTNAGPIEASDFYCRHLLDSAAGSLIIAAFTLGGRIDKIIQRHLDRDELFEAFLLKQWSATMTEQVRAGLTRALREWAFANDRSLLPFDGPGYNGWPLRALAPLVELLYRQAETARPVRVTESGVMLPTNSMLIVHGLTCTRDRITHFDPHSDRLAQCHRCSMQNCSYRVAPAGLEVG